MRPAKPDPSPAPSDARAEYERFAERVIEELLGARQVRHLRVEARALLEEHADIRREVIDEAMAAWREVRETGDEENELARAAGQFAAAVWCRAVGGPLAGVSDELRVVCLDRMIPAKILSWLENHKNPKVLAALSDMPDKEERVSFLAEKLLDQAGSTRRKARGSRSKHWVKRSVTGRSPPGTRCSTRRCHRRPCAGSRSRRSTKLRLPKRSRAKKPQKRTVLPIRKGAVVGGSLASGGINGPLAVRCQISPRSYFDNFAATSTS